MYGCTCVWMEMALIKLINNKSKLNNKRHECREGTNKEERAVEVGEILERKGLQ